jgi:hypothetical protein
METTDVRTKHEPSVVWGETVFQQTVDMKCRLERYESQIYGRYSIHSLTDRNLILYRISLVTFSFSF